MGTGLTDSPSRPSMDSAARKDATQRPAHASALQAQLRACGDAQRWDEAAALRWFEAHRLGLRERQARAGVNGAATIAVGLGVRWHETPSSAKLTREQAGTAR